MTLRFFKPQTKADRLTASDVFAMRTLPAPQQPSLVRSILVSIAIYVLILVIGIMIGVIASRAFLIHPLLIWAGIKA
jgi:hypothetical protein